MTAADTPANEPEARADDPGAGPEPLFTPGRAVMVAALTGLLYGLAMPGFDLWPLALASQAPLYLALRGQTPGRAALLGGVAGLSFSIVGCYWFLETLQVFSGLSNAVCVVLMLLLSAYQGGRAALTGWLHARAVRKGWPGAPVFALAFIAGELLWPLLFPYHLAVTLVNVPVLLQVADLGGVYLASLVAVGPSLALAEVVRARMERSKPDLRVIVAGLAFPLAAAGYGAFRMARVDALAATGEAIRVGVAQGNQPLTAKREGLRIHRKLTGQLRRKGAELVVWSESALPGQLGADTYRDEVRDRITGRLGVPTIFGTSVSEAGGPRHYNTALMSDDAGAIVGRYDKHLLVPFGEYLPLGETFPSLYEASHNSGRVVAGSSFEPMRWRDHRITPLICYEDTFPGFVNTAVRAARPDLLVNITVDTWFGDTIEPREHLGLSQLRAIEHHRYLVRATNSGISAIIDPAGRITAHGGEFTEEAFVGEVRFLAPTTLYELLGDWPFYAGSLVVLVMGFVRRRRLTS